MMILEHIKIELKKAQKKSHDKSKQTSAVIFNGRGLLISAANTFTEGVDKNKPQLQERPTKYSYIEHAERNVIYSAANQGLMLRGLSMACSWFPCADCARAIVQSGIEYLYYIEEPHNKTGMDFQFDIAREILEKGKVKIIKLQD